VSTRTYTGIPLAPGFAEGRAFIYGRPEYVALPKYPIQNKEIEKECARFERALQHSIRELEHLRKKVVAEIGEAESQIFEAHLELLKDPTFVEKVKSRVTQDLINVDHAVEIEIKDLEKLLSEVKNEYLRERKQDIRDVGLRLQKHLQQQETTRFPSIKAFPPQTIIVARELLPSDTIEIDRSNLVGIVTERGGTSSHAAILARALGIPSITGIPQISSKVSNGDWMLIDAQIGTVTISPTTAKSKHFHSLKKKYDDFSSYAQLHESEECVTKDGVRIKLFANIGRAEEADLVPMHNLEGIGLFRTEYLFFETDKPPTLRKHLTAYKKVAKTIKDRPIVIRTLDLGGDKKPFFMTREFEANPNLGCRGLRFSLLQKRLFITQLRAILRANLNSDIRVMFPMVLGAADLNEAVAVLHEVAAQEKITRLPRTGAMIETPAAIFEIDEIMKVVDFLSIGTNDLTQFILAADRNSLEMVDHYSVLHPAVIKAITKVIEKANTCNCPLAVCGEDAGDPDIACLLIGLGLRELSISPVRAARIRQRIRSIRLKEMENMAQSILLAKSVVDIKNQLHEAFATER